MDADVTAEHRPVDGHGGRIVDTEVGSGTDGRQVLQRRSLVRERERDHFFPPDCRVVTTTTFGGVPAPA